MQNKIKVVIAVSLMTGSVLLNAQEPPQGGSPFAPPAPPEQRGGDIMQERQGPNKPPDTFGGETSLCRNF